jgi:hypothetical protein
MLPVCGRKCLSSKAVGKWEENFSERRSKVAEDARPGAEVAETTFKNFYAAGFDALVKRWDKLINDGGGYAEKQIFFSVSNITYFTFYIHL